MEETMNFLDLARKRYSVRRYKPDKVDRRLIMNAVEAARLAPSACNAQPWHFIVSDEPERVRSLAEATLLPLSKLNRFVSKAPVIVAVVAESPNLSSSIGGYVKNKPYYLMDIGMAAEHFCLQAAEDGLGTCILGWFNEKKVKKFLNVPKSRSIPLLITLGYPEEGIKPVKNRIPVEKMCSFNTYGSNMDILPQ